MSDDVKSEVLKMTQDTLGKFIMKPPLTEKLLKKPPFRFLHDIVTATIRDTGFLSGLYTDSEMKSENIKDREMKIAFLQKLIDCVKIVTEKNITARPSKIVAGLEPTKTNELLQAIGFALNKKLDSSAAVAQLQGGGDRAAVKSKSKPKDDKQPIKRVKEKTDKVKQSPSTNSTPRSKLSNNNLTKKKSDEKINKIKESPRIKIDKNREERKKEKESNIKSNKNEVDSKKPKTSPKEKIDKMKETNTPDTPKEKNSEQNFESKIDSPLNDVNRAISMMSDLNSISPGKSDSVEIMTKVEPENIIENEKSSPEDIRENSANIKRSKSRKAKPLTPEINLENEKPSSEDIRENSVNIKRSKTKKEKPLSPEIILQNEKPSSSEDIPENSVNTKRSKREQPIIPVPLELPPEMMSSKEPPKMEISRPKTSLRPPSVRPSSARPGAPRLKDRNEIILPPDELVSMGKVNVIVENFSAQDEDNEEIVIVETTPEIMFQEPVAPSKADMEMDIPTEKGHLVAQILEQISDSNVDSIEPKKVVEIEWEGGGVRNREAASKEMEKLRDSIQTLTRAANPLGKLMNFLQEDVDSMRSELKMWIEVNEKLMTEIKTQERLNSESIEPLKKQLSRLEEDIIKQHEQIAVTQANILKNEQKIKMLLTRD